MVLRSKAKKQEKNYFTILRVSTVWNRSSRGNTFDWNLGYRRSQYPLRRVARCYAYFVAPISRNSNVLVNCAGHCCLIHDRSFSSAHLNSQKPPVQRERKREREKLSVQVCLSKHFLCSVSSSFKIRWHIRRCQVYFYLQHKVTSHRSRRRLNNIPNWTKKDKDVARKTTKFEFSSISEWQVGFSNYRGQRYGPVLWTLKRQCFDGCARAKIGEIFAIYLCDSRIRVFPYLCNRYKAGELAYRCCNTWAFMPVKRKHV